MPKPAWENLDDFLQPDTAGGFAFPAVLTLPDGSTRTFNAIYDDPYMNAQLGEFDMDTTKPRLLAKETDLAGAKRGCTLMLDGELHDIMTYPQPTGDGMAVLELAKQTRL